MPVPVAFPLASFLARAGITALGTGAATEGIKSLQNQGVVNPNMAQQALMRTIMGPTSEIFNRTTDTPSGKVFAPTGEVIEPNQIPGIAPPEQQQGITGLPIPEKAPGLPGLINPEQVDTSILNKEETEDSPILTENLTEKESKYLTELLTDTGGGKFEAEILQEVPSLMIKDNKLIIKQKDLNSFDKFLDELYIGEKAPSGKGADTIPPRLRGFGDFDTSVVGKLFKNTTDTKPSLTEVSTNPSEPFDNTDTSAVDFFPFNPIDFKKNGILNNPEIVKAFDDLKNDVKIKPPVGFNEDYMALQQSDSFYLTPPRAQMEITLKYLEKQLEENKASEETLNLIKNLNKDLQAKIKDTGYYAENKKVEDRITNLPGMTNKLKKLKSSN
jgi:hypothetical protein